MTLAGAVLILTGLSVGLVSLVALHLLPTGMSPLHSVVSNYGITAYHTGYRARAIAYALAGAGAALGVSSLPGPVGVVVVGYAVSPEHAPLSAGARWMLPEPSGRRPAGFTAGSARWPSSPLRSAAHASRTCSTTTGPSSHRHHELGARRRDDRGRWSPWSSAGGPAGATSAPSSAPFYALMTAWLCAVAVLLIA